MEQADFHVVSCISILMEHGHPLQRYTPSQLPPKGEHSQPAIGCDDMNAICECRHQARGSLSPPPVASETLLHTHLPPLLLQLDSVELVDIRTPIPSISPRFGGALNLTLTVTPDIANGEIGFTSNATLAVVEPEDANATTVQPRSPAAFIPRFSLRAERSLTSNPDWLRHASRLRIILSCVC